MSGTRRTGITLKDVAADTFITEFANHLKKGGKLKLPVYHDLVKTAFYKELPPYSADWYYTRAAAIIRRVYCRPGQGVGALRRCFGGSGGRGACPSRFALAAGGIIRGILIQLEGMGLIEKMEDGGRRISKAGQKELDLIAAKASASAKKQQ